MDIHHIPDLFQDTPGFYPLEGSYGGIKLYQSEVDTLRANVQLSQNLLVFVLEGRKLIYHRDGVEVLTPFEGAFLKKGSYLMSEKRSANNHYKAVLFCFNQEMVMRALPETQSKPSPRSVHFINRSVGLEELLTTVTIQLGDAQRSELNELTKSGLNQLLEHIHQTDPQLIGNMLEQNEAEHQALRDVLENHFTEALPLQQLAFLAGLSLSSFKRHCEKLLGTSPHRWIREKRLELARQLVQSSETAIADIGFKVGYENTSHFIKLFKETFGHTPQALRQQETNIKY